MAESSGTYNRAVVATKTMLPLRCIRINSTNTTATLMNAMYQI